MQNKANHQSISALLLIGIILTILDFVFNPGLLFLFGFGVFFIIVGSKKKTSTFGKLSFWFGIILIIIMILSMFIVKLFLFGLLIFSCVYLYKTLKKPRRMEPTFHSTTYYSSDSFIQKRSRFQNKWFGNQHTPTDVYEWEDINIQTGFGDAVIDLSNTVLPKGVSVISIRGFVGNIQILVPYEEEVSFHHSALTGSVKMLDGKEVSLFNEVIHFQTENFDLAESKIKIITSLISGKVEVKRV